MSNIDICRMLNKSLEVILNVVSRAPVNAGDVTIRKHAESLTKPGKPGSSTMLATHSWPGRTGVVRLGCVRVAVGRRSCGYSTLLPCPD